MEQVPMTIESRERGDAGHAGLMEQGHTVNGCWDWRRRMLAGCGPGMLAALADTDAGNVIVAAHCGAQWGYRMLPLVLVCIPALYMVQELAIRLAVCTGSGQCELLRKRFGLRWAAVAAAVLAISTIGTLLTEMIAVAGVGEMYGLPRSATLAAAAALMIASVLSRSWQRVERVALMFGLLELVFFYLAYCADPAPASVARQALDWPVGNSQFAWAAIALIGTTFNPWMIYYQQSAVASRFRCRGLYRQECRDTIVGVVVTQFLTGAVLVTSAAIAERAGGGHQLDSIGDIGAMLTFALGKNVGRAAFGAGVLGASMVAAIVSSIAMATGIDECFERSSTTDRSGFGRRVVVAYLICIVGCMLLVWRAPSLVSLVMGIQVLSAFTLPFVFACVIVLTLTVLPHAWQPRGIRLIAVTAIPALASVLGILGFLLPAYGGLG